MDLKILTPAPFSGPRGAQMFVAPDVLRVLDALNSGSTILSWSRPPFSTSANALRGPPPPLRPPAREPAPFTRCGTASQGHHGPMTSTSTIILQQATAAEDSALRELSQLDSARTVSRPALMAVVDDELSRRSRCATAASSPIRSPRPRPPSRCCACVPPRCRRSRAAAANGRRADRAWRCARARRSSPSPRPGPARAPSAPRRPRPRAATPQAGVHRPGPRTASAR